MSSRNGVGRGRLKAEDPSIRDSLAQLIQRMTPNAALREDLMQEAIVHLWQTESRRPGQTRSWYLQSCRFHLQHYLNSGRSIDSAKRWRDQLPITDGLEEESAMPEPTDSGNSVLNSVSAREIISLLEPHLSKQEQAVLGCLADGLGAREIGRALHLSHTMVIRHRRKIAALFRKLEVSANAKALRLRTNGHSVNGNGHHRSSGSDRSGQSLAGTKTSVTGLSVFEATSDLPSPR